MGLLRAVVNKKPSPIDGDPSIHLKQQDHIQDYKLCFCVTVTQFTTRMQPIQELLSMLTLRLSCLLHIITWLYNCYISSAFSNTFHDTYRLIVCWLQKCRLLVSDTVRSRGSLIKSLQTFSLDTALSAVGAVCWEYWSAIQQQLTTQITQITHTYTHM